STGATQVNKALQQLDQVIQQNAAASEEMASTAEELSSQADVLQSAMAFFKVDDARLTQAPETSRIAGRASSRRKGGSGKAAEAHSNSSALAHMSRALNAPGSPNIQ